jgi:DNA-binding response OmpR family regulator
MKTIVIQDTEPELLEIITFVLQMKYNVYPFLNCDNAFVDTIKSFDPDLILMEHRLEGHNCVDSLKKIKINYPKTPVVAFTTNHHIKEKYRNFGFDDYLLKPFDFDVMFSTVERNINLFNRSEPATS